MRAVSRIALVLLLVVPVLPSIAVGRPLAAQAPSVTVEPLHFHHVHLNSAVSYEDDLQRIRGREDRWHFGWNTPNSRQYDEKFRAMGLQIEGPDRIAIEPVEVK